MSSFVMIIFDTINFLFIKSYYFVFSQNSKQENAVANSDISASTLPSAESQQSDPPKTQEKKKAKTRCGKCKAKVSVLG